ncbi:transporter substrate-binding domain-containing protein [uncultured Microbulbifer sp.]|uniref:transporter substrate-binding domain-containing protein n=1 Tax=uncultured Microbulbifer sp. TaxID=348147 RepID=UPI0026253508|nr:transporter substrate-binding domain-containing protein [uncultured Microbulbifer sp.]
MQNILRVVIFLLVFLLLLVSCQKKPSQEGESIDVTEESAIDQGAASQSAEPKTIFANYQEQGDFSALQERGILRLLAPRGPEEDALPRAGLPQGEWRQLAEKFAYSRDLQPQWIYVDNFAALIPALTEGRGDVIATNFSRTFKRGAEVAFTRPLQAVNELLITRKGVQKPLEEVAVRRGSAYAETLATDTEHTYKVTLLDGAVANSTLLAAVVAGEYQATVMDSNLADALLPAYPQLTASDRLESRRDIAWAVRPNATELRRELNEFLTAELVLARQNRVKPVRDWQDIIEGGTLRVLTRNHPASYFIWRGELMGFDYDLLKKFSRDHKLRLSMVVPDADMDLAEALRAGMGDVIAASLTVTELRRKQGLVFSRPYLQVREQLIASSADISLQGDAPLEQMLSGKTVAVNPQTSYHESLAEMITLQRERGIAPIQISTQHGATTEHLINAVAEGLFPYTVADSHLVAIESTYRDDFRVVADLPKARDIAWAVREDQPQLLKQLNNFLKKHHRDLFFNVTYNKYFKEKKHILRHQESRLRYSDALSPYDPLVHKYTERTDRDWRMVVAQMYQESQFNPRAQSFAGAQGLMQVLPRTANQMGVANLYEPENGIRAGVSYLDWLDQRFPEDLPLEQKIYFTLAAYNAGHGHVRDARTLAQSLGLDPNQWFGHVEQAMLLLSKPEYYRQSRFGYVRGREPVKYVREIRDRYLGYIYTSRNF